jgi:hypothetical protein
LMHGMADAAPESQAASADGATTTVRNHSSASSQEPRGDRAKDQKNGADLDDQRAPHDSLKKNLVRGHANLTPTKRATLVPNNRVRSGSANVISLQQRGSTRSGGAQGKVLIQKETVISTVPVRPPRIVRPTPTTLNNVRHRSPNPAIISGFVNSKTGNAGAINGTRMDRRR